MAGRPNWRGYLKLSLVSCPVALHTAATAADKVSFHLLNAATGHRLKRQFVDSETGEVVPTEEQQHGYEVHKGEYITVEDEELAAIAIESTHTIEVDEFVKRADISDVYLDTPYYLVPDDAMGEEAFAVIREAMRERDMAGIARVVLYKRERVLMLEPHGRGIVATTLRFPYEIKPEADFFGDIPDREIAGEMVDLAGHIIDTKAGVFEPDKFEDRYEAALVKLIEAKQAGKPIPEAAADPAPSNVVDLMEALRRSVGGSAAKGTSPVKAEPAPKAKAEPKRAPASKAKPAGKTASKPAGAKKPAVHAARAKAS